MWNHLPTVLNHRFLLSGACILLSMLLQPIAFSQESQKDATNEILVFLSPRASLRHFTRTYNIQLSHILRSKQNAFVFAARSAAVADMTYRQMLRDKRVEAAYLNRRALRIRHNFTPNDPYFFPGNPSDSPGQWYLVNSFNTGLDINVQSAWVRDLTGQGVVIGIVDDGIETTHPDLAPNFSAANSFDFARHQANPDPFYVDDNHGTAVAGLAAARGGNGIGITGVAPFASLAGLRCDFLSGTIAQFVDATLYRSPQIAVKNHSYGFSQPYVDDTAESDAVAISTEQGTIHVYSAGNDRGTNMEDGNKQDTQNSPDVITVAALGSTGRFANYSEFGANITVTAPSETRNGLSILVTDRQNGAGYNPLLDTFPDLNYFSRFGGTSASAPLVVGALALAKQVQPNLTTRLAKHLLVRTSTHIDPDDATETSDGGWRTNAAGIAFNQNYGFGLINTDRLTQAATEYSGVTPLVVETTSRIHVNTTIPDGTTLARTFTIQRNIPMEEILLTIKITHSRRGDIEIYLTSPSGTRRRLLRRSSLDTGENINNAADTGWTFSSHAFWGENPQGTWTVEVQDVHVDIQGTWDFFSASVRMGTPLPADIRAVSGQILALGNLTQAQNWDFTFRDISGSPLFTRNVTTDTQGRFMLTDIPAGNYLLSVKGRRWLRRTIPLDLRIRYGTGLRITMQPGDIVDNNQVDVADFSALRAAFGSRPGDASWNDRADLNGDDTINAPDLALLRIYYGQWGDP
jgi:hypothetical protein